MRFNIDPKTRAIDNNYSKLGVQGENKIEVVEFVAPKIVGQVDLSGVDVKCLLNATTPSGGNILKVLPITIEENRIVVKWEVGLEETEEVGYLKIALHFSTAFDNVFKTTPTTFEVMDTISVESNQPILFSPRRARSATTLLAVEPEVETANVIENKIIFPARLQNLAMQNDNESRKINFIMARYENTEDLSKYPIKLHLQVSDGSSEWIPFTPVIVGNDLKLEWTVQRPHTSYAGKLRMQIEVGDITTDTFFKQTEIAEVNILNSLDGDTPIVPVSPPEFAEYLSQIEAVKREAIVAKDAAVVKAGEASASATKAKSSETNSEINASKSEGFAKKSPYVGADGYWYVYDFDKNEFVKNVYAGGRKLNGAFDTLEELKSAYPNGDGNHEYRVGDLVYSWDGTSWNATSGASDYADITNTPEIDNVKLKAGNNTRAELRIARDVDAFIQCTSEYDTTAKRHALRPAQINIALPDVFAVRFVAAAGFAAGDTLYLDGVEYTPAYTDSAKAVEAGRWRAGAVVEVTLDKVGKRAYLGKSFSDQFEQKVDTIRSFKGNDFSEIHRMPSGKYVASNSVTGMPKPGYWFLEATNTNKDNETAAMTVTAISMSTNVAIYINTFSEDWSGWKPLATATPPQEFDLPLTTGFSNVAGNRSTYSKDQLGRGLVEFTVEGDIPANTITSIGVLPAGFRPSHEVHSVGYAHNVPSNKIAIWINQNGPVVVYAPSAVTRVTGQISFIAT